MTSSSRLEAGGFPHPHEREFLVQRSRPSTVPGVGGLTWLPQAATARPAADWRSPSVQIDWAAFVARAGCPPHCGHVHARSSHSSDSTTEPQAEPVLLAGDHRSILTSGSPSRPLGIGRTQTTMRATSDLQQRDHQRGIEPRRRLAQGECRQSPLGSTVPSARPRRSLPSQA